VNGLVSLADIQQAANRIRGVARVSPLLDLSLALPSSSAARRLSVKCENLQPGGAFKLRGAYNMLAQLTPDERSRGIVTYSSGNHGRSLALAAHLLGVRAVVVMPTTAPGVKIDGAKRYGAEVLFEGTTTLHRKARAEAEARARGLTMVPPFDHPWIIAGQGTIGLEVVEQCADVGTVYVQVGGGGLISGIAAAVKRLTPQVRVVGVEPCGAPKMSTSLAAGHPVTLEHTASIADGLLAVRPGEVTFPHVQALVDEVVTIGDEAILDAMRWLFEEAKLVVEPSGAITVAAAFSGAGHPAEGTAVAVLSGGNIAPETFAGYLTSGTAHASQDAAPPKPSPDTPRRPLP
jgi:threonine dehydratase